MLPYRDSRLTKIAIGIFFAIVAGYAYFEARGMLFGPKISIPAGITEVHEPFITLKGRADRIASLSMNGKVISVTEDGAFEEPYLLSEGINRIVFDARDKYGRSRQEIIQVVYVRPAHMDTVPTKNGPTTATTTPVAPETP